jgi:hypothetical protein
MVNLPTEYSNKQMPPFGDTTGQRSYYFKTPNSLPTSVNA